jgi:hypothetical protein
VVKDFLKGDREMEDIVIAQDEEGTAMLTTVSALSSYGQPVFRIESEDPELDGDYTPWDFISPGVRAADVVKGWAMRPERTPEELEAADRFLQGFVAWQRVRQ